MAKLTAIYTSGVGSTYFRARNYLGLWWYTVGSVFEAWNGAHEASYHIAATEDGTSGIYEANVPGSWGNGPYLIEYFDPASSSDPLGAYTLVYDGSNEVNDLTIIADLAATQSAIATDITNSQTVVTTAISESETNVTDAIENITVDVVDIGDVVPVYVQVGTGEVVRGEITAYQFAAFGGRPYVFHVWDSEKPQGPINLSGHNIVFVCSDQDGTFRWQIENCTVFGTYSNMVKVEDDDTNTSEAGNFRYVLRDQTDDVVLQSGRLIIEEAADVETP